MVTTNRVNLEQVCLGNIEQRIEAKSNLVKYWILLFFIANEIVKW